MTEERTPFLSRWSQRKVQVRQGASVADLPPLPQPTVDVAPTLARAEPTKTLQDVRPQDATTQTEPPPTLLEASQLTPASDFSRFVKNNVSPEVKNTALKQLFADPHFNVMDRLDTYIDDYNTPDPLPASWLRKMTQSAALGLFDDEEKDAKAPANADPVSLDPPGLEPAPLPIESADPSPHENPDLRLQQDDAAGQPRIDGGAEQNAGRQH